jgi:hypothetical protein
VLDLGVGRFAGGFKAVNDHAARIGLKIEQMPVKGGDLDAPAGGLFDLGHQPLADDASKPGGTGPEVKADD